jgi:hypothetical protein
VSTSSALCKTPSLALSGASIAVSFMTITGSLTVAHTFDGPAVFSSSAMDHPVVAASQVIV